MKKGTFFQSAKTKLGAVALGAVAVATNANAALGDDFTVDNGPVLTVAGVILTAIGGIWAVKKVIALGNKS